MTQTPGARCGRCQHGNPDHYRYCGRCGHFIGRACPACGFLGLRADRFCGGCGRALGAQPASPEPPAERRGERRHATIVFSDLSGYTAMNERLDPEDVAGLMGRIKATAVEVMEAHGGFVNQFIGDEIVTLFGIPMAREDDPVRAVRATLELHARVAALGEAWRARIGRPVVMHSGINTGLMVTDHRDARDGRLGLTGDAVNVGARLLSAADGGEVLIGPATHRRVEAFFVCEPLPAVALRGKAEPMVPYRVVGERETPAHRRRPLVGRLAERARIDALIDSSLGERRAGVLILRGAAGLGKTRLMEHCAAAAEARGFTRFAGWILDSTQGAAGDAIGAVCRGLAGIEEAADPAARDALARAALEGAVDARGDGHLCGLFELVGVPLGPRLRAQCEALDNHTRQRCRREVLTGLLRRRLREGPALLLIEDLHWADARTLADLATLAAAADGPALVVMSTRPTGDPGIDWLGPDASPEVIELAPLDADEAAELAALHGDVDRELAAACIARAEGNPLFLSELLADAGAGGEIPGSVQSLVLARLDRLDAADRRAAQRAAVCGQRPELALVRWLVDDPLYEARALVDHQLVRRVASALVFAHALIRDGIYHGLLKAERRRQHARIAEWYADRDPATSARHYALARHEAAAATYLRAARDAADRLDLERAAELAAEALGLEPPAEIAEPLRCLRARCLKMLGDTDGAIALYRAVVEGTADPRIRMRASIGLADGLRIQARIDEALAALEPAVEVATTADAHEDQARIHLLRGNLYFPRGEPERCLEQHTQALHHARAAGSAILEVECLGGLGDGYYALGRMRTANGHFRACVERARSMGLGRVEAANLGMIAHTWWHIGDEDRADAAARDALDAARRTRHHRAEIVALAYRVQVAAERGEADAIQALYARVVALQDIIKTRLWSGSVLSHLALARCYRGDPDAPALLDEALAATRENGWRFSGPLVLGHIFEVSPDPARRADALAEGHALLARGGPGHNPYALHTSAVRGCLMRGEWQAAVEHAERLAAYTGDEDMPRTRYFVDLARLCAAIVGDPPDPSHRATLARLAAASTRAHHMLRPVFDEMGARTGGPLNG